MNFDPIAAIDRSEVFADIPAEERKLLARGSRQVSFRRGEVLFLEGASSETYGIVLQGYLKLVKSSASGKETILELLGPGDVFGALVAMELRPYPVNVIALSEGAATLLAQAPLVEAARKHPTLMHRLLLSLGPRLRQAQSMIVRLVSGRVESRIASVLLLLARPEGTIPGQALMVGPSLTRQDIADLAGTTVETAIRVLSAWQKQGLVASRDRHFHLLLPERLEEIADSGG